MRKYTVNVLGNKIKDANERGYHAYFSEYTSVTAIEVSAKNKREARKIIAKFAKVLYVFE